MSKMKRKWLRVIECEESGQPIDDATRELLMETHPTLPIRQGSHVPAAPMMMQQQQQPSAHPYPDAPPPTGKYEPQIEPELQAHGQNQIDARLHDQQPPQPQIEPSLQAHGQYPMDVRLQPHPPHFDPHMQQQPQHLPQIDSQLEQQLQREIATADPPRA